MKKEVKVKSDNDCIIAFNPLYLNEALENIDASEIEIKIGGQVKPTIIKDSNNEYLIMPQRIK